MTAMEQIRRAVAFIEDNLAQELTLDDCARTACYSPFHFHRLFHLIVGVTVTDYIRQRRLSAAAVLIAETSRSIKEIAFACGFNSQEAFIRAFRSVHGITPGEYRKAGNSLKLYHPATLEEAPGYGGPHPLKPRLVEKPAFLLAGYGIETTWVGGRNAVEVPKLWNRYNAGGLLERIACPVEAGRDFDIGLSTGFDLTRQRYTYITGREVARFVPADELVLHRVPAALYAVFSTPPADHHTFVRRIQETWRFIYQSWLPESGYEHAGGFEFETYCEASRSFSEEIYIPLKKMTMGDDQALMERWEHG